MTSNTTTDIQMQSWTQAFADKSENSFADAFADNVILEASVLVRPIKGRDCVKSVMAAASKVYEALTFTHQVESAQQTYLEWDAEAFDGQPLSGVTILIKNPDELSILLSIIVPSVRCSASQARCASVLRARSSRTISTKESRG